LLKTSGLTCLVFGSNGFIGSNLAKKLNSANHSVTGVSRNGQFPAGLGKNIKSDFSIKSLKEILKFTAPDVVFLAYGPSSISWEDKVEPDPYSVNISTETICNTLFDSNQSCKVILISSAAVYGEQGVLQIPECSIPNPTSSYGRKKLELETILDSLPENCHIEATILRVFSTFGFSQKRHVVWDMYSKFKENLDSDIYFKGNGSERRDFLHIDDLTSKVLELLLVNQSLPRKLNIGSGISSSTNKLASIIKEITKSKREFKFSGLSDSRNPMNLLPDLTVAHKLGMSKVSEDHFRSTLIETLHKWDTE
jgi:UDP-glucose 4-epimerase